MYGDLHSKPTSLAKGWNFLDFHLWKKKEQAVAELGQAQLKLELELCDISF